MRAKIALLLVLLAPALASAAVLKIEVNAPIHPITSEYIRQSIDLADKEGFSLVLLTINTPGGLDSSMREIIEKIVNAATPVAAYVAPSGARAASAGFFIGVACDIFIMASGTSTGSAHPVGVSITGQGLDETTADKITNDAAAFIRTLAEKRGRNVGMAEGAVRESLSYTEKEALEGGLIDLVADTDEDILLELDGRRLKRFKGDEIVLSLHDEPIIDRPMSSRQKFLLTISNPNLAYLLLMLGLVGLYLEFSHPGAVFPGILGGISLLLAVFSFQILPINYVGLLLILFATILFILEVKIASFGMLTLGGIAAMVIGSLMLVRAPIPELRPSLKFIIPTVFGVSVIFIFLVYLVIRAHSRRSFTGKEGMIGEVGSARTDLDPAGKVFVHGELWEAEADESVKKGERIRVIGFLGTSKIRVTKA